MVTIEKHLEDVGIYAMETVKAVRSWLGRGWLILADEKWKAVLVTNRRKKNIVQVGSVDIRY